MADMHILTGNNAGSVTLAMHFPVPNTNNDVTINYRDALVASNIGRSQNPDGTFGRRSILPPGTGIAQITTTEEALLDSGALFEHVESVRVPPGGPLLAQAQAHYAISNATVQQNIAERLRFFGHTASAT